MGRRGFGVAVQLKQSGPTPCKHFTHQRNWLTPMRQLLRCHPTITEVQLDIYAHQGSFSIRTKSWQWLRNRAPQEQASQTLVSIRESIPRDFCQYDSEILSALKSNMGAGEISFFSVADYLYFCDPSIRKISRLNLQNSLRMIPDLKKDYSFSLVWPNMKIHLSGNISL